MTNRCSTSDHNVDGVDYTRLNGMINSRLILVRKEAKGLQK